MIFLWYFPRWFSYGFPIVFLLLLDGFHIVFLLFLLFFLWLSCGISCVGFPLFAYVFLWFAYGCPMVFRWVSYGFAKVVLELS